MGEKTLVERIEGFKDEDNSRILKVFVKIAEKNKDADPMMIIKALIEGQEEYYMRWGREE